MKDNKQFKSLRTSLKIYKFYAWLIFHLFTVIAILILFISYNTLPMPTIELGDYAISLNILDDKNIAFLAAGVLIFIGSLIYIKTHLKSKTLIIFLSIEENTRLNTELLTRIDHQIDVLNFKNEEGNLV
jgi:hypothetical protein